MESHSRKDRGNNDPSVYTSPLTSIDQRRLIEGDLTLEAFVENTQHKAELRARAEIDNERLRDSMKAATLFGYLGGGVFVLVALVAFFAGGSNLALGSIIIGVALLALADALFKLISLVRWW